MSYSRRSPRLCEALTPTVMRHTGVEKSAEAIVVATRRRRAESAVRSRTWIAQTTGKKSEAGNRENLATKGGEVECRDMGARCQSGCDEKRTREHAERTALNCGNREVPATGMLRGVGGEAFLPYPIVRPPSVSSALPAGDGVKAAPARTPVRRRWAWTSPIFSDHKKTTPL